MPKTERDFKPFVILLVIVAIFALIIWRHNPKLSVLLAENKIGIVEENLLLKNSPVFKEVMAKSLYNQVEDQISRLGTEKIYVSQYYWMDAKEALEFLTKLQSCERCKKTFAFFGSNNVFIKLNHRNKVLDDHDNFLGFKNIYIDIRKSPEEITDWLITGKVK